MIRNEAIMDFSQVPVSLAKERVWANLGDTYDKEV
jgi:hypothetical protein